MVYLNRFALPSLGERESYINGIKATCYISYYPFNVFELTDMPELTFEPITILYGGNGSGKSTILNVIGEKLGLPRDTPFNRSSFFDDYVSKCRYETRGPASAINSGRVITSDDVFDYLLNIRSLNDGVDVRREDMYNEYYKARDKTGFQLRSMDDYQELKRIVDARRLTYSSYVRKNLGNNVPERSNGESALAFFVDAVRENALYLLDEPENSLSAERQNELVQFLSDSARFYGCQLIIATHSPFLLALPGACVYNLDANPPRVQRWTELDNVRAYFDFFMKHRAEFE